MRTAFSLVLLLGVSSLLGAPLAFGHGALVEYAFTTGITIQAQYDTGDPMPEAQVTVYAPDNPAKPWLRAVSDGQGRFSFVPDPDKPGVWTVQSRLAGHGAMVHIPVEPGNGVDSAVGPGAMPASAGLSAMQRLLMALSIVWGFVGTALFFSRRRSGGRSD